MIKNILILVRLAGLLLLLSSVYSQNPTWIVYNTSNSLLPSNVTATIVIDTNNIKWIGTDKGMVRIDGNDWQIFDTTNSPAGTNGIYPIAQDSFNNIWCGLVDHGIAKYTGILWTIYNSTNSGLPANNVSCISIDNNNVKWIGCGGLTKFDGSNWVIYNTTNSGLPSNAVSTIAIENHIKWIGTFSFTGGVAKFNDTNWIVYNTSNSGLPSNPIRYITLDNIYNKWICTEFGGLAKFNSFQNNWTIFNTMNSGLPSNAVFTITILENYKFINCQNSGFTIYNDIDWQTYNSSNSPLPDNNVNRIAVDKYKNIWMTTHSGVAVYNPNGIIAIEKNNNEVPESIHLFQNYPNPFNPTTTIKFDIPKSALVKIIIYDINGKLVDILQNSMLNAGSYSIKWDGSKYSSGIYFYCLITEDILMTKKFILLK
jgi:ligand-binding sensor domain-containing protein